MDGRVLCVHGGLSPDLRTLDQVCASQKLLHCCEACCAHCAAHIALQCGRLVHPCIGKLALSCQEKG